jgi:hypothetical protein
LGVIPLRMTKLTTLVERLVVGIDRRDSAFIFRIALPRCAFTVISLMPSLSRTCLLNRPETTNAVTSLRGG